MHHPRLIASRTGNKRLGMVTIYQNSFPTVAAPGPADPADPVDSLRCRTVYHHSRAFGDSCRRLLVLDWYCPPARRPLRSSLQQWLCIPGTPSPASGSVLWAKRNILRVCRTICIGKLQIGNDAATPFSDLVGSQCSADH